MTGWHLTGWGLPSLRWAVATQWSREGLSHRWTRPPGAPSYGNQSELRTGNLPRHVLCWSLATLLECPLQFALRPGREGKETPGCPYDSVPLSVSLAGSKGKEEPKQLGTSSTAEAAGRKCWAPTICLRGSTPDLSSRFTPEAFRRSGIAARRFEIRVYLPLDGLPSQAKSPIYPGQLVIRCQWLHPLSCRWCQFRRAEARSGTIVTVLLTSLSRSVCLVTDPHFFPLTYGQCASGLILKSAGKRPVSNFELGH